MRPSRTLLVRVRQAWCCKMDNDPLSWYKELPIISRCYLTGAFAISGACFLDWISPLTLYYNYDLIFHRGQYWRLFSSFLFFGPFSLDFLFHMYFVVRYCRLLEEGKFRERTADLLYMIIFGIAGMVALCIYFDNFSRIKFLGHSLSFMMVYVWARGRENAHVRMSFLGLYTFNAPYLPWVLFLFSLFLGNPASTDLLGIIVGHAYYFLDVIYPTVARIRGWPLKRIIVTPFILCYICGDSSWYGGRGDDADVMQGQGHVVMPVVEGEDEGDLNHDGGDGDISEHLFEGVDEGSGYENEQNGSGSDGVNGGDAEPGRQANSGDGGDGDDGVGLRRRRPASDGDGD